MSFSENLKKARLNKGYTQQDVADRLNISVQAYSRYETTNQEPGATRLKELSDILNVSIDQLLGLNPVYTKGLRFESDDALELEKIYKQIVEENMRQLNVNGQKKIVDYSSDLTEIEKYTK
ncbi:MAG: helix-turn-helix transcriptional regulator [Clostridiaceae bacterium]|nr:helix-turn-helix transcriptional regulator [Clostridiaceae bacterium]